MCDLHKYKKEEIVGILSKLISDHEDDEIIQTKIMNGIHNLESTIKEYKLKRVERKERSDTLNEYQKMFMNNFFKINVYFYLPSIDRFYLYDGAHYNSETEDNIHYNIMTTIQNDNKSLIPWKYKTRNTMIKCIREHTLYNTIPESRTIQYVFDELHPLIFKDRLWVKYFLTILGDLILRKNTQCIYFIPNNARTFIKMLNHHIAVHIERSDVGENFKCKYHDHDYDKMRLIDFTSSVESKCVLDKLFKMNTLDLIAVACHYSSRFKSAEYVLGHTRNRNIVQHARYFKDNINTKERLVDNFLKTFDKKEQSLIKWSDMQFIWKLYLEQQRLPNAIYAHELKTCINTHLDYDEKKDVYINCRSKIFDLIDNIRIFWEDNFIYGNEIQDCEFETGEICDLYEYWCNRESIVTDTINEELMKKIIVYLYPGIIIEDHKYFINIRSDLWNKRDEVLQCVQHFQKENMELEQGNEIQGSFPIYDAYQYYCNTYSLQLSHDWIVNKRFFEKCIESLK
jgi:hypothetical protein